MNWIKRHRWLSVFLVLLVLYLGWSRYDSHFTPRRWAETDISHRGKLVDSLLRQYNGLEGMSRAEVESLLGADTDGMQVRETFRSDGSSEKVPLLVYAAGGRSWTGFPEYLCISLENDRVVDVRVLVD